jgi:hypothetical protein
MFARHHRHDRRIAPTATDGMLIRRVLGRLLTPPTEWIISLMPVDDPWKRISVRPRPMNFGPGSRRDFRWYFEGDSEVKADSIDAICDWLRTCEYADDMTVFNDRDFWQHPRTFEHLRRGDCEDHALWAWRKLVELGVPAEFVAGRWDATQPDSGLHAWVMFRDDAGEEYILETVTKGSDVMLRPASQVRAEYVPHFAVDHDFRTVAFAGYILEIQRRRKLRALPR